MKRASCTLSYSNPKKIYGPQTPLEDDLVQGLLFQNCQSQYHSCCYAIHQHLNFKATWAPRTHGLSPGPPARSVADNKAPVGARRDPKSLVFVEPCFRRPNIEEHVVPVARRHPACPKL